MVFLTEMGGVWVEKHLSTIARHVLELLTHQKTTGTHIDAVYSRRCVSFILRSVFGKLLGESAQFVAAKHLCQLICRSVASLQKTTSKPEEGDKEKQSENSQTAEKELKDQVLLQHMIICAILEIGALVYSLNTAALPLVVGESGRIVPPKSGRRQPPLLEALNHILRYPTPATRLAGAWCMRCIGLALPSQLGVLVDYCLSQLRQGMGSLEAVSGYSFTIAALLATVRFTELGIPAAKAKVGMRGLTSSWVF